MMHNVVALKLATVLAAVVLLGVYASASTADLEGFDDVEDKTPFVQPHNAFKEATEVVCFCRRFVWYHGSLYPLTCGCRTISQTLHAEEEHMLW
jgi:hypothetical protein